MSQQNAKAIARPKALTKEELLKYHMQAKPWPWFYSFLKKYLPFIIPGLFMVAIASALAVKIGRAHV